MKFDIEDLLDTTPVVAEQIEAKVFKWCTQDLKFTSSATALAKVYVSCGCGCVRDHITYFNFHDLRCLDRTRLGWAAILLTAAAAGWRTPDAGVRELIDRYGLRAFEGPGQSAWLAGNRYAKTVGRCG